MGLLVSQAAAQFHPFKQYAVEDGLPSEHVYRVVQDSQGYIWVCTDQGLARFDGYQFQVFTTDDGLPSNDIFNLTEDHQGRLWVHTFARYFTYFSLRDGRFHRVENTSLSKKGDLVSGILESATGDVGIVIAAGMIWVHGEQASPWIAGQYLCSQAKAIGSVITVPRPYLGKIELPSCTVAEFDSLHRVYLALWGDADRLIGVDASSNSITVTNGTHVMRRTLQALGGRSGDLLLSAWPISDALLLVITQSEQFVVNAQLARVPRLDIQGETINAVFEDREHNLWYCLQDRGLWMAQHTARQHPVLLQDQNVRAITGDRHTLWLATSRGELFRHDIGSSSTKRVALRMNGLGFARHLLLEPRGLWALFDARMLFIPQNLLHQDEIDFVGTVSETITDPHAPYTWRQRIQAREWSDVGIAFGPTKSFLRLPDGAYLLPDSGRFDRFGLCLRRFLPLNNYYDRTYASQDDRQGRIWYGGGWGLSCQDQNGQDQLARWKQEIPQLEYSVKDLTLDQAGWIWVATDGYGLFGMEPEEFLSKPNSAHIFQLLPGTNVKSVYAAADGCIWASTPHGAFQFRRMENGALERRQFSIAEGLPTNSVNAVYVVGDTAYIATQKGLAIVDLVQKDLVSSSSPLYVTALVDGKEIPDSAGIELPFGTKSIVEFNFVALSYQSMGNIRYQYRTTIDGDTSAWIPTMRRNAQFLSLASGEYLFEVKATDIHGLETNRISRSFTVLPPWWREAWFYVLLVLLLLPLVWGISALRIRYIRVRERRRSAFIDLRLQALQAQMNPHFVSNTLVAVQALITEGKGLEAREYLTKFADLSRRYLEASYQKWVPIQEELAMLQSYLELEKLRFGDKFVFEIVAATALLEGLAQFPSRLLQPLAENAIHHGLVYLKRQGLLRIEVVQVAEGIMVVVEDDGIGRVASARLRERRKIVQVSRGTALIDEILQAINEEGEVKFRLQTIDKYDALGEATGTRVEVHLVHANGNNIFRKKQQENGD